MNNVLGKPIESDKKHLNRDAISITRADVVWEWISSLKSEYQSYLLQDLPRWLCEHRSGPQELNEGFCHYWSKRQEFRSVLRYRAMQLMNHFHDVNAKEDLERICAGISWMFVQNLYLSCNKIGSGLYIEHGFSTIIYARSIGENFRINQNVTIGTNRGGMPTIGNNCSVYTGAIIIGDINIGNNVRVGAGAVVVDDIPSDCTVVPPKARVIQRVKQM